MGGYGSYRGRLGPRFRRRLTAARGDPRRCHTRAFGVRDGGTAYSVVTVTLTESDRKDPAGPLKLPTTGTACAASRATATRMRLRPPTRALVGSNSTQPAPGR